MVKTEGWRGLFHGNGANVLRIVPFTAVQFSSFQLMRQYIISVSKDHNISLPQRFYCGVVSGILATCVTYPLDFIRCRLSLQTEQFRAYTGIFDGLYKVIQRDGFLHLYSGLLPTIVGIVPYSGIQLGVYDLCRTILLTHSQTQTVTPTQIFVIGSVAGVAAQTVSFPIETVRRRLQVVGFQDVATIDPVAANKNHNTVLRVIRDLWNQSGIFGFYRGLLPNYIKIIPAAGISFLTYESIKNVINDW
uniref:Mitochondrial substrate carrier family protein P n=1 Tax=Lygus hesperus TaxID=30085 RepID=A0A0A9YNN6_LYGHE